MIERSKIFGIQQKNTIHLRWCFYPMWSVATFWILKNLYSGFFLFLKMGFNAILQHHFSLKMENYHLDDFCGKPCLYNRFVVLYQTKMTSSHWMKESRGYCLQTFLYSQKENKDRSMVSNIIWCKAPFGLFPSLSFPHAMVC